MSAEKAQLKRFILRALHRTDGIPMSQATLEDTVQVAVTPKPLVSTVRDVVQELEVAGFLVASRDDLTDQISYTLTTRGKHKAIELGG